MTVGLFKQTRTHRGIFHTLLDLGPIKSEMLEPKHHFSHESVIKKPAAQACGTVLRRTPAIGQLPYSSIRGDGVRQFFRWNHRRYVGEGDIVSDAYGLKTLSSQ